MPLTSLPVRRATDAADEMITLLSSAPQAGAAQLGSLLDWLASADS
ncbi:hypothetical protein [Angustibacter aerolatus]